MLKPLRSTFSQTYRPRYTNFSTTIPTPPIQPQQYQNFHTKARLRFAKYLPYIGHGCYIVGVFIYATSDIVSIRVLSIVSSMLAVVFNYLQPMSLKIPMSWNIVFISMNIGQLIRYYYFQTIDDSETTVEIKDEPTGKYKIITTRIKLDDSNETETTAAAAAAASTPQTSTSLSS